MISNLPNTEIWMAHLNNRIEEAKNIGLIDNNDLKIINSNLFIPNSVDKERLNLVTPDFSIRKLEDDKLKSGWNKRRDMFNEVSIWIIDTYKHQDKVRLFCEAGYSEIGDKVLEKRPHINYHGNPILFLDISSSNAESISNILRWGRSSHLLGIIADINALPISDTNKVRDFLFLCDVFDNDSIIVSSIQLSNP